MHGDHACGVGRTEVNRHLTPHCVLGPDARIFFIEEDMEFQIVFVGDVGIVESVTGG